MSKIPFFLLIIFCMYGCQTMKVMTDHDRTVDFNEHKSLEYYGWADNSDRILNSLDKERIEKAFAQEFKKRGVSVVPKGEGDMVATLYIVTQNKVETTATTSGVSGSVGFGGYGYGYGRYGYGPAWGWGTGYTTTTYHDHEYKEGTLIISLYDKDSQKLIWEAIARGTIDENLNNRDENIGRAVKKIMTYYPVRPKK